MPDSIGARVPAERFDRLRHHLTLAADAARGRLDVVAPFTGETLSWIPRGTATDVAAAVERARVAQRGWAAIDVETRADVFRRFHDLLLDRQDEALDLIQLENGKARAHAFEEIIDCAIAARYYSARAARWLRPRRRRGFVPGLTVPVETRRPLGVVGFIVPWNYPLNLAVTDPLPAMLAGNAVVVKPDHQTTFTALWAAELMREAGLPSDLFQVVPGRGDEIGPAVVDLVDAVMFTGSTATGRTVAERAARRLIHCSLELGGKNPMIVLDDADVERAAAGAASGAFVGAGQTCVSIERIYVHASVRDDFMREFVARTRARRLGAALDYSCDVGSLTSRRQLDRVQEHVADAVAKGATVAAGGRARPDLGPFFYEPTILTGVTPDMTLHDEETFGPVVSVYTFESDDEAVARANATRYGLTASVWSRDARRARGVAERIDAGAVGINDAYGAAWGSVDAPMGGMKESGPGRRHGREGLLTFTHPQAIVEQRLVPLAAVGGGGGGVSRLVTRLLRLMAKAPGLR